MAIDEATVRRVARLARIAVTEDDLAPLARDLSSILDWVEQLQAVDVDGVEPMAAINPGALPRRADEVTADDPGLRDRVLDCAPDAREGFFAVPKVVE